MNTGKSHNATSNWQLLCFFGFAARNAIIGETMLSLFLPPAVLVKKENVCVRVFNSHRGKQKNGKGNDGKVGLRRSCQK